MVAVFGYATRKFTVINLQNSHNYITVKLGVKFWIRITAFVVVHC